MTWTINWRELISKDDWAIEKASIKSLTAESKQVPHSPEAIEEEVMERGDYEALAVDAVSKGDTYGSDSSHCCHVGMRVKDYTIRGFLTKKLDMDSFIWNPSAQKFFN